MTTQTESDARREVTSLGLCAGKYQVTGPSLHVTRWGFGVIQNIESIALGRKLTYFFLTNGFPIYVKL